jgi:hypothetical protein
MTCYCAPVQAKSRQTRHSYFILMQDLGRRGREAVADPELTRDDIVDRLRRHDYHGAVAFIHHVEVDEEGRGFVADVTNDLLVESGFYDMADAE